MSTETVRRQRLSALGVTIAVLLLAVTLSLAVGSRTVPPADVWRVLWSPDDTVATDIVLGLRLPRTLLGIEVGAALGLAGALMQALTRNPLAEPGLLGVNLGASTAVVVAIGFLGVSTTGGYVWFAFAGAAVTAAAVFAVGGSGRNATPERQVLAGVSLTAVMGAFVWAVLVTQPETFDRYRFWDVGSLADRDSGTVTQITPFLLAGVVLALSLGRRLNMLGLGDEAAVALGAHPGRTRLLGIVAITLLCGAATAAVGPIWFLGLAVPYVARLLTGPDNRWVLTYSLLVGPSVLLLADVVGRVAVAPSELQVGVVTAFAGAPVFLILCRRRRLGTL
ncbi:FecCD family ABC transporter permease [Actinoplanes couchii]|uniref:FecCD family ABC transporter permease n=1 Tax=Actinoplanes couchii TaxID=403638 RepID=UPI00194462A1|nr:iron chelate uptake ABC transporter family permease subunit [Actinoplanes couchii]MDR6319513.1 iron complex transport system permease protein [Actinoplanes couchii]